MVWFVNSFRIALNERVGGCTDEGSGIGRGCVLTVNVGILWLENGLRDKQTRGFNDRIKCNPICYWKRMETRCDGIVGCVQALEHSAHEMRNEDPGK